MEEPSEEEQKRKKYIDLKDKIRELEIREDFYKLYDTKAISEFYPLELGRKKQELSALAEHIKSEEGEIQTDLNQLLETQHNIEDLQQQLGSIITSKTSPAHILYGKIKNIEEEIKKIQNNLEEKSYLLGQKERKVHNIIYQPITLDALSELVESGQVQDYILRQTQEKEKIQNDIVILKQMIASSQQKLEQKRKELSEKQVEKEELLPKIETTEVKKIRKEIEKKEADITSIANTIEGHKKKLSSIVSVKLQLEKKINELNINQGLTRKKLEELNKKLQGQKKIPEKEIKKNRVNDIIDLKHLRDEEEKAKEYYRRKEQECKKKNGEWDNKELRCKAK